MYKRTIFIFSLILLISGGMIFRLHALMDGNYLTQAAARQSSYTLQIDRTRGYIFDRFLTPLVNTQPRYIAAILPSPEAATTLAGALTGQARSLAVSRMAQTRPFAMEVPVDELYSANIDLIATVRRYDADLLAPHIIGHLGGEGTGVMGMEKAYDSFLSATGKNVKVKYAIDGIGRPLQGAYSEVVEAAPYGESAGVVLTLDARIQKITQDALSATLARGAAVVMDVVTGDILASASVPAFSPTNLVQGLENPDSPFVNRAFSAYNIGSTFKLITAAAALESGVSSSFTHTCTGYIDIGGVRFHCHNRNGHGTVDMKRAMEVSCNTYFIALGQKAGAANILEMATRAGLGEAALLAPGFASGAGNVPAFRDIQSGADLANISFGQGTLMATPVQIAQLIAGIANGGTSVTPRLVLGKTLDGEIIADRTPIGAGTQIMKESTAKRIADFMVSTVEIGSGRSAKPLEGGAGGKTASAQTGLYNENEEIVHAWFSGFYPAKQPQYAIVVLAEGMNSGGTYAAPVFKRICDGIAALRQE